jgi:hypothetical protein
MLPWLFPVGLLGAVVLVSVSNALGYLLAVVWGWIAFPYVVAYARAHSLPGGRGGDVDDSDTQYWRTKLM